MNCCELSLYAILRETNEKNWKKRQKIISRSDFGSFGPNLSPNNYFRGFYNYQMLDIIASYQCMQFQGKIMNQTWENGKKPSLRPDFVQISPNSGRHFFFFFFFSSKIWLRQSLDIMGSYHHVKLQKKLMIQSWEN